MMKMVEHRRWARVFIYVTLAGLVVWALFSYQRQADRDRGQTRQLKRQTAQLKRQTRQLAGAVEQNDTARRALCALRRERRQEVRQGVRFLKNHPDGAFGFTASEIKKNVADKRVTLKALSILHCDPKEDS